MAPDSDPADTQVMELNESPVFLLYHTRQSVVRKDLPVSLYESGKLSAFVEAALKVH